MGGKALNFRFVPNATVRDCYLEDTLMPKMPKHFDFLLLQTDMQPSRKLRDCSAITPMLALLPRCALRHPLICTVHAIQSLNSVVLCIVQSSIRYFLPVLITGPSKVIHQKHTLFPQCSVSITFYAATLNTLTWKQILLNSIVLTAK